MNVLQTYLESTNESLSAFAARIGRSPSTLSRALSGARNPSFGLARDVERGTGGCVSAKQFLAICLDGSPLAVSLPDGACEAPSGLSVSEAAE